MQVSDQSRIDRKAILERTLGRIQSTLQLSPADVKDYFGFTENEYISFNDGPSTISQSQLDRFATKLNLDPLKIMKGEIDYYTLVKQHNDKDFSLPDRYKYYKKSIIKTTANIFDYLDRNHPGYSDIIVKKLQLCWGTVNNPTERVNAYLVDDIFALMGELGFSDTSLINSGIESAKRYYFMPEFASSLWSLSTPRLLLDHVFNEKIYFIDGTLKYQLLMLTDTHCQIKATTRDSVKDAFKTKHFGCKQQCTHRLGFVMGLLQAALNKNITNCYESKCVHHGDEYCVFEFFY